jgi:hypothetical protein
MRIHLDEVISSLIITTSQASTASNVFSPCFTTRFLKTLARREAMEKPKSRTRAGTRE